VVFDESQADGHRLDDVLRRLHWFKCGFHEVRDRVPRLRRRFFVISDGRATFHVVRRSEIAPTSLVFDAKKASCVVGFRVAKTCQYEGAVSAILLQRKPM
jgi:hypothetical protein